MMQVKMMESIHDNKPPISSGAASLFIDMIFWQPQDKDLRPLIYYLEQYHLGERSQTVEWLTKFTLRLAMWNGKYWFFLTPEEWGQASQDLIHFISDTAAYYHPKKIEYDTRSFSVGLAKRVRRETRPLSALAEAAPRTDQPVWWLLKV